MVIAVDFDGSIVEHAYPLIGKQIGRSIEILRHFKDDYKCRIILWTCREPGYGLEDAVTFCADRELTFDTVNVNLLEVPVGFAAHKVVADLYIDDRSHGRYLLGMHSDMTPAEWDLICQHVDAMYVKATG